MEDKIKLTNLSEVMNKFEDLKIKEYQDEELKELQELDEIENDFETDFIEDVITPENKDNKYPVIPLEEIIVNLFSGQNFLTKLFIARERILTQLREGKLSYYMFDYPGLGWIQYNHDNIEKVYYLAGIRTGKDLAKIHLDKSVNKKLRLHSIFAILLQREGIIRNLYNTTKRARELNYKSNQVAINFPNPFKDIFPSTKDDIILNGRELIKYQDYGHKLRFKPFIPYPENKKEPIIFNNYKSIISTPTMGDKDIETNDYVTTLTL
jgi:hypothetical protein